jgi:transcriptional regulator with XRE-family HTH domain
MILVAQEVPVPAVLESAVERHIATCRAVLGTDRAVANVLGVSPSQITRWRRGQVPDLDNADRLAGLALILEMAARWFALEAVEGWLHGPNAHLNGRAPAYLIRSGQVADVVGAIEAEKAGVYA